MKVIAWLVLGAAACGGGASVDPTPDAGVAPGEAVTLRFAFPRYNTFGPALFCRDASGAIVDTVAMPQITAPTTAACRLPAGGSVDVLMGVGDHAELTSFRDIAPGDAIEFDYVIFPAQTADTTAMTIKTPTASYGGTSSCGTFPGSGGDLPAPPTLTDTWLLTGATPCEAQPIDLLFLDDYQSPTQFAWQPSVAYVPGAIITLPAWQPLTAATIGLANVPAGLGHVTVDATTRIGTADAFNFAFDRLASFENPAAGALAATLPATGTAGRGSQVRFESGIGISVVDQRVIFTSGVLDGLQIDFADQPLPVPRSAEVHGNTVTWTETGSGTGDVRYVGATREPVVSGGPVIQWQIYSDPADGARAQTIYPLPAAYANVDWTLGTSFVVGANVEYADSDQVMGWGEAKANPARAFDIQYGYQATASRGHQTISY